MRDTESVESRIREGRTRSVGSDRVAQEGDGLVVYSDADMAGWEVRRYRRIAIRFGGRRFVVTRRSALPEGGFRYDLVPWPADLDDDPDSVIDYTPEYVATRDARRRAIARGERRRGALLLLLPVVGFLPSGWKAQLHERYGINPRTATLVSLAAEYVVLLLCGLLFSVFAMARAYGGVPEGAPSLRAIAVLAGVVLVDAVFRTGAFLEDTPEPPGIFEWLVRGGRRRR